MPAFYILHSKFYILHNFRHFSVDEKIGGIDELLG
jgi:hypothetical protein